MKLIEKLLHPSNLITLSGLIVFVIYIILLYLVKELEYWLSLILFLYGYALADILDGIIARKFNYTSFFGELFDLLVDRIKDGILAFTVLVLYPEWSVHIFIFIVFKIAPEVLWSRVLGSIDHKNKEKTNFSKIYSLFHNYYFLGFYCFIKTIFFMMILLNQPYNFIGYIFIGLILLRSLSILEFLNFIAKKN